MIDIGLATYLGNLQAAWKDNDIDGLLWYAVFDGSGWSAPAVIPGAGSDVGPALDIFKGLEYAAWKGSNGDPQIWYSSTGASGWAAQQVIPGVGTDVGPSLAQYDSLLYAAWVGEGGDPRLFYSSFDGSGWASQQVIPGVGSSVGPSLAAWDVESGGDGKLYAAWKGADGDTQLYYSSFDGSGWASQQVIPGGSDVGPSLRVIYGKLYAAWKGADGDPALYFSSFDGSGWAPQQVIPGVGSSIGPALAVFNGLLYVAWRGAGGDQQVYYTSFDGAGWAPQAVIPGAGSGPVPAPSWGLGSNSNYILASDCNPLIDLSVTIEVTEDIVWQSASGTTEGFAFQLNAYSPSADLCAFQQYFIYLGDTLLKGGINNFNSDGSNVLVYDIFVLTSLPDVTLPAGYVLQISLQNDSDGNVVAATYGVFDNQGNVLANVTQDLLSVSGTTSADLAPIIAFELDFVGPDNKENAVLSSGAGWFAYESASPLTVLSQEPPCIDSPLVTAETTNSSYSAMPAAVTSNSFIQYFNVTAAATTIRKQGTRRPGLIVPRA